MVGIDLGSNTIRAVDIDCESFERKRSYEKAIRCAEGLQKSGLISKEAIVRAIDALKEIREEFDLNSGYKAVATAAFRMAKNGKEALGEIVEKSLVTVSIIDSDAEAYLTTLAIKKRASILGLEHKFVAIDIGGASTEVIYSDGESIISQSFPVGIVTMSQKYGSKEALSIELPKELAGVKEFAHDMRYAGFKPKKFLATSGAPTTMAAMKCGLLSKNYDYKKINGTILEMEDLDTYLKQLLLMDFATREAVSGVGRGDLIVAGVLIYKELFKILGFKSCTIIDDSLREGAAIAMCLELP